MPAVYYPEPAYVCVDTKVRVYEYQHHESDAETGIVDFIYREVVK